MSSDATCFGCGAEIEDAPGVAYCDPCVARQVSDQEREREAFDAFHRFADAVARADRV